ILLSTILYYSELANAQALVRQRNQTDSCFIDGYFTKIHNAVEFLSSNTQIRNAIAFDQADNTEILTLYKSLQLSDPDINYVYSGYNNGSLLINDYTPPAGFNSVVRPWYKAAMAAQPDISDGIPYQDIIDKQWLVSITPCVRIVVASNFKRQKDEAKLY
ncbi:MAG: cache domain-containing protein, partial [Desulfuromonadales bacterium]|nr:cache domain-containing protein [Desulfuromonadales bacterium]